MNLFKNVYFRISAGAFAALLVAVLCVEHPRKIDQRIAQRKAAGISVPVHWYVQADGWRGLACGAVLAALLVALTPWVGCELKLQRGPMPSDPRSQKWLWLTAGGLMLFSAAANYPRLHHSLWGDEEYAMKRLIAEKIERGKDGRLEFEKPSWVDALWSYRKTTNHIGQTVVSRLVHDAFFQPGTGPTDPIFSEALVRLPVFIAGLLSIAALAWAAVVWGWQRGAPFALIMYALHPWFVRFGSDARAYGFVLLLVPLMFGLLGRALQTGQWRWWLAFAIAQFYLLWSYLGAVHFVAMINVAAAGWIWRDSQNRSQRWLHLSRWTAANLVSAILLIGLMAPCIPQFLEFMQSKPLAGKLDLLWWQDAVGYLLLGLPWQPWDSANPLCEHLFPKEIPIHTISAIAGLTVRVGLVVSGGWILWRHPGHRWLLLPVLAGLALMILHSALDGVRPYHWYLIPYLPGFVILWAATFARMMSSSETAPSLSSIAVPAVLAICGVTAGSQERANLRARPIEPCRESAALTRTITNPRHLDYDKDVITGAFSFYTEAYDPGQIRFENADGLKSLMRQADSEGKKLFVNFGFKAWAQLHFSDVVMILDGSGYFEHVATLHGQFHASTREVYRYKNGTLPK